MPAQRKHNSTSDRLLRAGTLYHGEAAKCLRGRAYFAASVTVVAALEAALRAMCSIYARDVKKTEEYRKKSKKGFRGKKDRAFEFSLYQLIKIAHELQWFPSKVVRWGGRRKELAGFVHQIRDTRNLVHADHRARRKAPMKFSKETFDDVLEVFEVANSWLRHRVEQQILKGLEREETKER
jgi:hypothetical protein